MTNLSYATNSSNTTKFNNNYLKYNKLLNQSDNLLESYSSTNNPDLLNTNYNLWNNFLNGLWSQIKAIEPKDSMKEITNNELIWIKEKENTNTKLQGRLTQERCLYLMNNYLNIAPINITPSQLSSAPLNEITQGPMPSSISATKSDMENFKFFKQRLYMRLLHATLNLGNSQMQYPTDSAHLRKNLLKEVNKLTMDEALKYTYSSNKNINWKTEKITVMVTNNLNGTDNDINGNPVNTTRYTTCPTWAFDSPKGWSIEDIGFQLIF